MIVQSTKFLVSLRLRYYSIIILHGNGHPTWRVLPSWATTRCPVHTLHRRWSQFHIPSLDCRHSYMGLRHQECANHATKCYRAALEKLAQDNLSYRGKGKLTESMQKHLTKAARCAIRMRSSEPDRRRAVQLLQQDLRYGPLHCFGIHSSCSTDFCKVHVA